MLKQIIWIIQKICIGILWIVMVNTIFHTTIPYTPITIAIVSFFSIPGVLFLLVMIYFT